MNEVWISQDRLIKEWQHLNLEQDRMHYSWNYRSIENAKELKILYIYIFEVKIIQPLEMKIKLV